MKSIGLRKVMVLCLVPLAISLFFFGCDALGTGGGAAADLSGIWLKVFPAPYFDYDGPASPNMAESMIMEISESNYQLVFYYDTVQVGGNRGTFAIQNGKMVCTVTGEWGNVSFWVTPDPGSPSLEFPYALTTDVLTLTAPDSSEIALAKVTFAKSATVTGNWTSPGGLAMSVNADGTFSYTTPTNSWSGTWTASGTTSGFMRSVAATIDGSPASWEYLSPYSMPAANTLALADETIPDPDLVTTYTK